MMSNEVKEMLHSHLHYTESAKASYVLENWDDFVKKFVKVIPKDYKRMMKSIEEQKACRSIGRRSGHECISSKCRSKIKKSST